MPVKFHSRKIQSQPIPGQPADLGQQDANRQIQSTVIALSKAVNVALTSVGSGLIIGTTVQPVGVANVAGSSGTVADSGHIHQGLHSITGPGGTRYGDVIFNGAVTQVLGTFTFGGGSTSPLTTKGDIWGYGVSDNRIPVGANGTVLTADSTQALGVKWATPASSSPVSFGPIKRIASPYTVLTTDCVVLITSGASLSTVTLYAASAMPSGTLVVVRDSTPTLGGFAYNVKAAGADTIDGRAAYSYQLNPIGSTAYTGAFFVTDGVSDWSSFGMN